MFRTESRYALHAAAVLAGEEGLVSNPRLAERLSVSLPMIGKILNRLVRAGVVASRPGPGGGYVLARPADRITLLEVVAPTEGDAWGGGCLLGLPACDDAHPCYLHDAWGRIREDVRGLLRTCTVAQLAAGDAAAVLGEVTAVAARGRS